MTQITLKLVKYPILIFEIIKIPLNTQIPKMTQIPLHFQNYQYTLGQSKLPKYPYNVQNYTKDTKRPKILKTITFD